MFLYLQNSILLLYVNIMVIRTDDAQYKAFWPVQIIFRFILLHNLPVL